MVIGWELNCVRGKRSDLYSRDTLKQKEERDLNRLLFKLLCLVIFLLFTPNAFAQLNGKKIGIDPGHGGVAPNCGHISNYAYGSSGPTGLREAQVNLTTALALKRYLEADGATVVMTRTTDSCVSLIDRTNRLNSEGVHRLVSVHHNGNPNKTVNYTIVYVYTGNCNTNSGNLAAVTASRLKDSTRLPFGSSSCTRPGIKTDNLHMVREAAMPAILPEVSFITNAAEETRLKNQNYLEANGWSLYAGIADHFGVIPKPPGGTPPANPPRINDINPKGILGGSDQILTLDGSNFQSGFSGRVRVGSQVFSLNPGAQTIFISPNRVQLVVRIGSGSNVPSTPFSIWVVNPDNQPSNEFFGLSTQAGSSSFSMGDRVEATVNNPDGNSAIFMGNRGTVVCIFAPSEYYNVLVDWDNNVGGHSGFGSCGNRARLGHGWAVFNNQIRKVSGGGGAQIGNLQISFSPNPVPFHLAPNCVTNYSFTVILRETNGVGITLTRIDVDSFQNLPLSQIGFPNRINANSEFRGGINYCRAAGTSTWTLTGRDDSGNVRTWSGTVQLQ
jgi:N-acetylmuramoyl-L-alanine amidase